MKGIEPSYSAWKAAALPLSYTRYPVSQAANSIPAAASFSPSSRHHRRTNLCCTPPMQASRSQSTRDCKAGMADNVTTVCHYGLHSPMGGVGFEPTKPKQRIYSPSPLTTRATSRIHASTALAGRRRPGQPDRRYAEQLPPIRLRRAPGYQATPRGTSHPKRPGQTTRFTTQFRRQGSMNALVGAHLRKPHA